jgi:hypothetical protein
VNRKLILLNVLLAGLVIWAGMQWRTQYLAEKNRETRMYHGAPPPAKVIPPPPIPAQPPVQATGYNTVAQKLLLHPTRNPDIPIDPPPPPPPPEPMPALPKFHGAMNLDGEPVAILSAGDTRFHETKIGQTIGQFKLVDVNTRDITFQWKDQQVRKSLSELMDRAQAEAQQAGAGTGSGSGGAAAQAPPPAPAPAVKSQVGPVGETSVFGRRACDPNDSYPDGAVVDGWRKSSSTTPFGKACFWERAGR